MIPFDSYFIIFYLYLYYGGINDWQNYAHDRQVAMEYLLYLRRVISSIFGLGPETPYIFPPYTEYPTVHMYGVGLFPAAVVGFSVYGGNMYGVKMRLGPIKPYIFLPYTERHRTPTVQCTVVSRVVLH